ncbi:MAG: NADP-dependent oxidoreductase [Deltaproteobacteria bacterium]|nr:NADP-dependent oxidoreductase [Deltaproteobacteria bacterium]
MKALGYTRPLEIGEFKTALTMLDLPVPEPAEQELLVQVKASSINIDDIHFAEGTFFGGIYPSRASADKPTVAGVDVAGTIVKVGAGVTTFKPGDDVLGFTMPGSGRGAWAEYCCLASKLALHKPAGYSFAEAAACAIGGKTAASAVVCAAPSAGEHAAVLGASGGIGSIVVQILARQGVRVTGICSASNRDLVLGLGAVEVVDYAKGPFDVQMKDARVDMVIDCVGGREIEAQSMEILKKTGCFVTLCGPEKYIGERRLSKTGIAAMLGYVLWRYLGSKISGPRYIMAGIGSSLEPLQNLVLSGTIKPPIDRRLPFTEADVRDGLAYIASHRAKGKIIIEM